MKVIYPDNIISLSADEEDANYPVENLQDDHPKKVWRGTSKDAKLSLAVSSGAGIGIANTNAVSITITLKGGTTATWQTGITWGDGVAWAPHIEQTVAGKYALNENGVGMLWAEYLSQTGMHFIDIDLTAGEGQTIEAGVLRAGPVLSFRDPLGIKEGLHDYSIEEETNNGAFYYRKRDIVRTFDFSVRVNRDDDFYTFMHTVARARGKRPLMYLVSSGIGTWEWAVYGRFQQLPGGGHDYKRHSVVGIKLIEVV
ncbi:MAG: hypothetical protein JRJ54_05800 [Deltaproteobacteria bacterium]|nr:hypothetical protein [Deltaproteobacteria bacterium]